MGTQLPRERGTAARSFQPMSTVATVAHLSYYRALVLKYEKTVVTSLHIVTQLAYSQRISALRLLMLDSSVPVCYSEDPLLRRSAITNID